MRKTDADASHVKKWVSVPRSGVAIESWRNPEDQSIVHVDMYICDITRFLKDYIVIGRNLP